MASLCKNHETTTEHCPQIISMKIKLGKATEEKVSGQKSSKAIDQILQFSSFQYYDCC